MVALVNFDWWQFYKMEEFILSFSEQVPFIFLESGPSAWSKSAADQSIQKKGTRSDVNK